MMKDFKDRILFLKQLNAPIEEIRVLEILQKEQEWHLLPNNEKQKKRKFAIYFLEKESHKNIDVEYEKNITNLYDMGEEIIYNTIYTNKIYLKRLNILINIQQDFINEVGINNLCKIRKLDINIFKNLFDEIKQNDFEEYYKLNLHSYFTLFEKIWIKNLIRL